jgi:hypothetical protein
MRLRVLTFNVWCSDHFGLLVDLEIGPEIDPEIGPEIGKDS